MRSSTSGLRGDPLDQSSILVLASDAAERASLLEALAANGHSAHWCGTLSEGLREAPEAVSLVVLDQSAFENSSPTQAFDELRRRHVEAPCLVTLRDASVDEAVSLMRKGAFSVVSVPIDAEKFALPRRAGAPPPRAPREERIERSLETHERLAMIGKLAAGVAHELNNPLDGVLRFVNLAVDGLPKESPQIPYPPSRPGAASGGWPTSSATCSQFSRNAFVDASHEDAERLARDAVVQVVGERAAPRDRELTFEFRRPGVLAADPGCIQQVVREPREERRRLPRRAAAAHRGARLASGRVRFEVADRCPQPRRDPPERILILLHDERCRGRARARASRRICSAALRAFLHGTRRRRPGYRPRTRRRHRNVPARAARCAASRRGVAGADLTGPTACRRAVRQGGHDRSPEAPAPRRRRRRG